jgi:hypothetical protein
MCGRTSGRKMANLLNGPDFEDGDEGRVFPGEAEKTGQNVIGPNRRAAFHLSQYERKVRISLV